MMESYAVDAGGGCISSTTWLLYPPKAHSIIKAVMNRLAKEEAEVFVDSFGRAYEDARTRFEKINKRSYPTALLQDTRRSLRSGQGSWIG